MFELNFKERRKENKSQWKKGEPNMLSDVSKPFSVACTDSYLLAFAF